MLAKYISLFLYSSVWKFPICDLNMKHWHQLKQMEIYKFVVTFFMNIIENAAFFSPKANLITF